MLQLKIIWNRRKIRRHALGLDLVLVLYKAGVVRVVVVLVTEVKLLIDYWAPVFIHNCKTCVFLQLLLE